MRQLAVFYHLWSDGAWQEPLEEFIEALGDFPGLRRFCIHGQGMGEAYQRLEGEGERIRIPAPPQQYEAVTMNQIRRYANLHRNHAVLYAHTKGASARRGTPASAHKTRWRRAMNELVVRQWRENLDLMERVDAVGCHWVTLESFGAFFRPEWMPYRGCGYFAGNFWVARCDYLAKLSECRCMDRYDPERWIGAGHPRVIDLSPGWPLYS